jgi:putative ABC transport system substrate-binding protein
MGLGSAAGCGILPPQLRPQAKIPRIGYLSGGEQDMTDGFRQGLAELGYVEGRNVTVELRNFEGQVDRLPAAVDELVCLPVDVLVTTGAAAAAVAKHATRTIPIVMAGHGSPVEDGVVTSLARPGGNITGLTTMSRELIGKRLEVLKAAIPGMMRVAVIWNPGIAERAGEYPFVEAAASSLGLELLSIEVRESAALDAAFNHAVLERSDGLCLLDNVVLTSNPARVSALAIASRLPMMSANRSFVVGGGLICYGVNRGDLARRAAGYVDKILKGTKPGDLPVEKPTIFDFIVNLRTAQALGLTIPQSILEQVTEVIQ